jgi:hypothetical protein
MDRHRSLYDRARRYPRDYALAHLVVLIVGLAACAGLVACILGYLHS